MSFWSFSVHTGTLLLNLAVIRVSQVYFLRDPEIDYSLGGVAGALDIPGLNKEHSPRCTECISKQRRLIK